jgi:hypothetical protein
MLRFSFLLPHCVDLASHASGDHGDRPQRSEELVQCALDGGTGSKVVIVFLHLSCTSLSEGGVSCPFATHRTKTGSLATRRRKNLEENSFHKKSRPGCQTEPFCPVGIGSPIFMKEAHRMKSYAKVT